MLMIYHALLPPLPLMQDNKGEGKSSNHMDILFYINIVPPNFIMELMVLIAQGTVISEHYQDEMLGLLFAKTLQKRALLSC